MEREFFTGTPITHIEKDKLDSEAIIYSHDTTIHRTKEGLSVTFVNSRFKKLTGFIQLNPQEILIVDSLNYCIKYFNRINNTLSDFAGVCTNRGDRAGFGTGALLGEPWSIIADARNPAKYVIISDKFNKKIWGMNVETREITTVAAGIAGLVPTNIVWDWKSTRNLLVSNLNKLSKLQLDPVSLSDISGSSDKGYQDGTLSSARYEEIYDVIPIAERIYIACDNKNNRLRLIDTAHNRVSSICTGSGNSDADGAGPLDQCKTWRPSAILYEDNKLYVAAWHTTSLSCKDNFKV